MEGTKEESVPLVAKKMQGEKTPASETQYSAVTMDEAERGTAERKWDGHLLSMCGSFDQIGLSTFAYVKLLSPLAFGHNFQRSFGKGFAKHAFIFALLFSAWAWVLVFSQPGPACGPPPPRHHDKGPIPEPKPLPVGPKNPEDQQFLTGATLNPQFFEEQTKPEKTADWVEMDTAEQTADMALPASEQIQAAKTEAAEEVAQLVNGRKLLHKHKHDHDKHDDDNDDDDEHHDKDHKKKGYKHKDDNKEGLLPQEEMKGNPEFGPNSPECMKEQMRMGIIGLLMIASSIIGVVYATKIRTAIRKKYGIKGSKCQDCLAWTFCGPCALCQEVRTLSKYNVHNGIWHGETVLTESAKQPLQAPTPMEAPTKPV